MYVKSSKLETLCEESICNVQFDLGSKFHTTCMSLSGQTTMSLSGQGRHSKYTDHQMSMSNKTVLRGQIGILNALYPTTIY